MTEKIFKIVLFCVNEIETQRNWLPFDELVLGLKPDRKRHFGQEEFLQKSVFRENGLHAGNGFGKTSIFAKKHLYFILKHFSDGSRYRTLNVAITQDQAELVQDEILRLIQNSVLLRGWFMADSVKFPHAKIRYSNGAYTEFKTTKKKGESIEGKEYGYISVDEVALELYLEFIRDKILVPRLRAWKDSQIDYGATPKGYTAFFRIIEDIKRKGGYVRGGSSFENPYIDHTLLNYYTATWSPAKIDQVIYGKFIDTADMMFASRVAELFDTSLSFEEVETGRKYIEGWDLARGRKKTADQTVGFRLKHIVPQWHIVKNWAFQLPWTEKERENINAEIGKVVERSSIEREIRTAQYESGASVYLDSTGVGDTLYGIVQDIAKPVDFRGGQKDIILDHLQAVIDAGLLRSPYIAQLADEMTTYQRDDTQLDTDYLMALAVACSSIPVKTQRKLEALDVDIFAGRDVVHENKLRWRVRGRN